MQRVATLSSLQNSQWNEAASMDASSQSLSLSTSQPACNSQASPRKYEQLTKLDRRLRKVINTLETRSLSLSTPTRSLKWSVRVLKPQNRAKRQQCKPTRLQKVARNICWQSIRMMATTSTVVIVSSQRWHRARLSRLSWKSWIKTALLAQEVELHHQHRLRKHWINQPWRRRTILELHQGWELKGNLRKPWIWALKSPFHN